MHAATVNKRPEHGIPEFILVCGSHAQPVQIIIVNIPVMNVAKPEGGFVVFYSV